MKLFKKDQEINNGIMNAGKKHITGNFPEHGHEFFEIEYILNGTGTYTVDGTAYPIRKNMLFFISPANFHAVSDCEADLINIMFSCDLCDPSTLFRLYAPEAASAVCFSDTDGLLAERLFSEILTSPDLDYAVQFLRCILYKIASLLPKDKNCMAGSHIQTAIIYILENFRSNASLSHTAPYVGLAPAYLSNLFLKETGINFKVYLDNLRFDYAARLLLFTSMSISEICTDSGFTDYANFTRRFKIKYGCTPAAYRRQFRL